MTERLQKEGINPGHYDMRFIKPLDEKLLDEVFNRYSKIITVEDGTIVGGFGSAVLEFASEHNYNNIIKVLGIPDNFIEHGEIVVLQKLIKLDAESLKGIIIEVL